jgi:hypothetical protein
MQIKKLHTAEEVYTDSNLEISRRLSPTHNYSKHAKKVFSQEGEDGIIELMFSKIPIRHKYYVEFGAGDGNNLSNTKNLKQNHGWTGLLMDASDEHVNKSNGLVMKESISKNNINDLFAKYEVPKDFDFLSIDVDGDDLYIFDAIEYQPSVILAEYNPGMPNHLPLTVMEGRSDWQTPDKALVKGKWFDYHGCNINAWYTVGKRKGYVLVTTVNVNVVLIREDFANLFFVPTFEELMSMSYFNFNQSRYDIQSRSRDHIKEGILCEVE